jgi:tetratricopeptide (TPR) repeat protein
MKGAIDLNHLNDVIRYHIANATIDRADAQEALHRFGTALAESGLDDGSIMLQDHWALFHEARGDLPRAIAHRQREIELVESLFAFDGPVGPIDFAFLRNLQQILHRHYLALGEHEKADDLLSRIQSSE